MESQQSLKSRAEALRRLKPAPRSLSILRRLRKTRGQTGLSTVRVTIYSRFAVRDSSVPGFLRNLLEATRPGCYVVM